MDKFVITGGTRLNGSVNISGAKNAAVAILPAVLLSDGVCRIENLPNISDVFAIIRILRELGADVRMINKNTVEIDPAHINSFVVPFEMTKHMRASSYFIGA
ncbi:MAG: UDP-N-acetylglucosamine 1-carboxyvinyltransferase, partial [Clostridia bacterium]|nr:UDP-N-acetylglucosamine 1-carboxyvinyltransferase [Clostridia bacterium]